MQNNYFECFPKANYFKYSSLANEHARGPVTLHCTTVPDVILSPQVAGLSEVATDSAEEVMRLLQRGNKERTQEPTAANKTSSRSHALLMVNVTESSSSRAANKRTVRNGR